MLLAFSRAIDGLTARVASMISWALLAAVLICSVNALRRYLFNASSNAWLEIQWYLFAAIFLLAAANTLKRDEHVRIDVLTGRLSRRVHAWIDLVGLVLFLLPFCALSIYFGLPYALLALTTGEMSNNAGGLILWPAKMLIPAGFTLLALQGISEVIKRVAFLAGRLDGSAFGKPAGAGH